MTADDDKALLLGNGYKAWFEVRNCFVKREVIFLKTTLQTNSLADIGNMKGVL